MTTKATALGNESTKADLPNHVMACPRCGEKCLFSTDWKGNATTFWTFAMDRINNLIATDFREWKNLTAGDPDCGFCEKLHANEADACPASTLFCSQRSVWKPFTNTTYNTDLNQY